MTIPLIIFALAVIAGLFLLAADEKLRGLNNPYEGDEL